MNITLNFIALSHHYTPNDNSRYRWAIAMIEGCSILLATQAILDMAGIKTPNDYTITKLGDVNFPQMIIRKLNDKNNGNTYKAQIQDWY